MGPKILGRGSLSPNLTTYFICVTLKKTSKQPEQLKIKTTTEKTRQFFQEICCEKLKKILEKKFAFGEIVA